MAEHRSPIRVVIYTLITFGFYGIYWFYQALSQVLEGKSSSPLLWFIGSLVPLVNLVILWKFSKEVEEYSGGEKSAVLLFILYLVFAPVAQYLTQSGLNQGM